MLHKWSIGWHAKAEKTDRGRKSIIIIITRKQGHRSLSRGNCAMLWSAEYVDNGTKEKTQPISTKEEKTGAE